MFLLLFLLFDAIVCLKGFRRRFLFCAFLCCPINYNYSVENCNADYSSVICILMKLVCCYSFTSNVLWKPNLYFFTFFYCIIYYLFQRPSSSSKKCVISDPPSHDPPPPPAPAVMIPRARLHAHHDSRENVARKRSLELSSEAKLISYLESGATTSNDEVRKTEYNEWTKIKRSRR